MSSAAAPGHSLDPLNVCRHRSEQQLFNSDNVNDPGGRDGGGRGVGWRRRASSVCVYVSVSLCVCLCVVLFEDTPLVEFMYLVFLLACQVRGTVGVEQTTSFSSNNVTLISREVVWGRRGGIHF